MQEKLIQLELLKVVSSLACAAKDILIAWMVLMTLWGMFSGYWAYQAIKRADVSIDYITGTFVANSERPLDRK